MLHIAKLKLSNQTIAQISSSPREILRVRIQNRLIEQRALVVGDLSGIPHISYKSVYRTDQSGNRIRVQEQRHLHRGWFEDNKANLFFSIRFGTKALVFDNAGNVSIEVGKLDALPGIIDALVDAIRAGELDAQLAAASAERKKTFKRRATKLPRV